VNGDWHLAASTPSNVEATNGYEKSRMYRSLKRLYPMQIDIAFHSDGARYKTSPGTTTVPPPFFAHASMVLLMAAEFSVSPSAIAP